MAKTLESKIINISQGSTKANTACECYDINEGIVENHKAHTVNYQSLSVEEKSVYDDFLALVSSKLNSEGE